MATLLKGLLPASIEGIPVYLKNEIQDENGRRRILHEYPNSSRRFVEDQGLLPPKFSLSVYVAGSNYLAEAAKLERALNKEGKLRVSMPNFGVKSLYAMQYKKNASQTSVGIISFEIPFVSGNAISGPSVAGNTKESVFALGDQSRQAINSALGSAWQTPSVVSNISSSLFDVQQLVDSVDVLKTSVDNVGDISEITDLISNNLSSLVRDDESLSEAFVGDLWQKISEGLPGGTSISELVQLTKYGNDLSLSLSDITNATVDSSSPSGSYDIPLWTATTANRVQRNNNRLAFVNTARMCALICAYEQAASGTYKTDVEIDETRDALEAAAQRLMRVDTSSEYVVQADPDVRSSFASLRLAALDVLSQQEQEAFSLTTVTRPVNVMAFVEAYTLYAEDFTTSDAVTTRGIELRELNPLQPADKMVAEITVFQA